MNMRKAKIALENIKKSYITKDGHTEIFINLSFEVYEGEFLCILGPTGCGKTTLINLIAGFIFPEKGEIKINREKINKPGKDRAVIFQADSIFPWYTVRKNIEYGLKVRNVPEDQRKKVVNEFIKSVKLKDLEERYPKQLSGGERKKIDIARAFANEPEIVLMDEPFGSLDSSSKENLQILIQKIWTEKKKTIVFVTHDIEEALFLSDRLIVLSELPAEVKSTIEVPFSRPRNPIIKTSNEFQSLRKKILDLY